jgi:hypothetical protein
MSEIPRQNPLDYQYTLKNLKGRKAKQVLSRDGYQWKRGGIRKG